MQHSAEMGYKSFSVPNWSGLCFLDYRDAQYPVYSGNIIQNLYLLTTEEEVVESITKVQCHHYNDILIYSFIH